MSESLCFLLPIGYSLLPIFSRFLGPLVPALCRMAVFDEERGMRRYRIALVPGDGIGKEVVPAGRQVLEALAAAASDSPLSLKFPWGGDYYRAHGAMMPDDGLDALKTKDAILFGSAGDPDIPDHITLVGTAAEDLPGARSVCQRAAGADSARHRCAAEAMPRGGSGLGDRAREHGGRVLGRRRPRAPGIPDGSGGRSFNDDARRGGAHPALCIPAGAIAAPQAADRGDQEQRAAARAW